MLPIIGITVGEVVNKKEPWEPPVEGQSHTYIDAVARGGGAPIIIPLVDDQATLRQLYEQCDGILLSGGNDLSPALYSEQPSEFLGHIDQRRDRQEMMLCRWALEDEKPLLGICRGMQLLNVAQGGTLYQDIASEIPAADDHRASNYQQSFTHIAHGLRLEPSSRLAAILKSTEITTNALHHQAIKEVGGGLRASAWAEDGIIEAIELIGKEFAIGVQSHPEALEYEVEPRWRQLFAAFARAAKN